MIIEQESSIGAPSGQVWARVVTPEGINDEMRPWLSMRFPRSVRSMSIDTVPVGRPVGRAWLRLFGVVPFDYDYLTITELEPGRRFHEKSTMLSMRRWEHERTLTPRGDSATTVHDRVIFQTRILLRPITPLLARVLRAFFAHRHHRLRKYFG